MTTAITQAFANIAFIKYRLANMSIVDVLFLNQPDKALRFQYE